MSKKIILGNKNLVLTYDSNLNIRDLYFPHIGDENHLEEDKNRIGFWVSGKFSWIDEEWNRKIRYKKDALVSNIVATSDYLKVKIKEEAAVHYVKNIYLKKIEVKNLDKEEKDIRIFFHNNLKLYGKNKNNTALYDPKTKSIIHYKKNRYFLFNGMVDNNGIFEYNTDKSKVGKEPNYKDAEDGKLENNTIAQGRVNSMISLRAKVKSGETKTFYYWIVAGKNFEDIKILDRLVKQKGIPKLLKETEILWNSWLNKRNLDFEKVDTKLEQLYQKSLLIIRSHINENGAIVSSLDYEHVQFNRDTYNYVWPRDGGFTTMALDIAGYTETSRAFYRFLSKIINREGFFWPKYYSNGALASTWHSWYVGHEEQLPIQEDQTAIVLISLYKHYNISKDFQFLEEIYENVIKRSVSFLLGYIDKKTELPINSYDIWENQEGVHFYTVATVYEALILSKELLILFGDEYLVKEIDKRIILFKENIFEKFWDKKEERFVRAIKKNKDGKLVKDKTMDSSILFITFFENFYSLDIRIKQTIEKTIEKLWIKTEIGGCCRFENDRYHQLTRDIKKVPGNPWILSTLLVGNYYVLENKLDKALEILEWVEDKVSEAGLLPEQIHPYTGEAISVSPYIVSHSMFIIVMNNYLEKKGIRLIK